MKLKTVEIEGTTYAEVQDGKPVYVDGDEKEHSYDAPAMRQSMSRLQKDLDDTKKAKEAAEKQAKAFEGIDDPEAARKALETVQSLDSGKATDAEKAAADKKAAVEAAVKEYQKRAEDAEAERDEARQTLNKEMIGGSFARSPLIVGDKAKLSIPADIAQARFGQHFTIEDGKVVAKDQNGNQIYSKSNPGEPAGFDEALEILVENYPHKDSILKGRGQNGSGARPGAGGGGQEGKTISRAQFDEINKSDPARAAKMVTDEGVTVTD